MPGQYTVQMLGMKYGSNLSDVRTALLENGVSIDLNDMVEVDELEKSDAKVKKTLEENHKAYLDAKGQVVSAAADKEKAAAAHDKSIPKVNSPEEWAAAVASGGGDSTSSSSESEEGE